MSILIKTVRINGFRGLENIEVELEKKHCINRHEQYWKNILS
jgi:hypothetical protein